MFINSIKNLCCEHRKFSYRIIMKYKNEQLYHLDGYQSESFLFVKVLKGMNDKNHVLKIELQPIDAFDNAGEGNLKSDLK